MTGGISAIASLTCFTLHAINREMICPQNSCDLSMPMRIRTLCKDHSINEVLPLRSRHLYTIANKPQRGLTAIPPTVVNAFVDAFLMVIAFKGRTDVQKKQIEGSVCILWSHYWTYATTKARSDHQKNRTGDTNNSASINEERQ